MDGQRAAAELEEERRVRIDELVFLENICDSLADEDSQDRMRRAIVLMLYAHFEGYTHVALEVYRRHINEARLMSHQVIPEVAVCALTDIFRAFRSPEHAKNYLPDHLKDVSGLRAFAMEGAFIRQSRTIAQRVVEIPEKYVDLESNLKPLVLKKNLFRLGLPHDQYDDYCDVINELLRRRNNIAHGSEVIGVNRNDYLRVRQLVVNVMADLQQKIVEAIEEQSYLESVAGAR